MTQEKQSQKDIRTGTKRIGYQHKQSKFRKYGTGIIKQNIFIYIGIVLGFTNVINAQNSGEQKVSDPYEMTLEQLGNTIITASKVPQPVVKVTQKVDVVTEEQIDRIILGNRNISELVQYLPGASVRVLSRNDANWGAYGGIGPKYSTYMLQGLPIDSFMDPMNLDVMAIQRIEVQRGPASIMYSDYLSQDFAGNQSPFAGTVNLILKETVSKPLTKISLDYGSYNTCAGQLYHENRFGRLSVFGGVSYEESDYTDYGSTNSWLSMLKDPEYQKGKGFLGASLYLDEAARHKITVFGNETFHKGDVGRINRGYDHQYGLMNAEYSGELTEDLKVALKSGIRSYDREWEEDNYSTGQDQSLKETDGVKQTIIPADLSLAFRHLNDSSFIIGSDFQHASYTTWVQPVNQERVDRTVADASQVGVYMQEELQLGKATIRGGGRFNRISDEIEKSDGQVPDFQDQTWNVGLWSVGTKYRFARDWAVFANAGSSFLTPGFKSIAGTLSSSDAFVAGRNGQLSNPDLEPEKGIGFDLGFDGKLLSSLYFSVRVFSSTIKDAIIDNVVSENPSQTMSVNADGKTISRGFEINVRQPTGLGIDWFANTTITKSEIITDSDPDQDGAEVPFVPDIVGNVGVTCYLPRRIEVSPMLHWSGDMYDSSSKTGRNVFRTGEQVNLLASKELELNEGKTMSVFIKLYNITNNKFDMPWQFRDPGFQGTVGLIMAF